jgi:hypothetical protein
MGAAERRGRKENESGGEEVVLVISSAMACAAICSDLAGTMPVIHKADYEYGRLFKSPVQNYIRLEDANGDTDVEGWTLEIIFGITQTVEIVDEPIATTNA